MQDAFGLFLTEGGSHMSFNLAVNVNAFPKCSKCKGDMVLVKVMESEEESFEKSGMASISMAVTGDTDEKNTKDVVLFTWKCGCGNVVTFN